MSDLRDLLDEAAGPPAGPVDVDGLRRRARRQQLVQAATVAVIVVAVVSVGVSALLLDRAGPAPVIEQPDPVPTAPAEASEATQVEPVPMEVPEGVSVEATLIRPSPWATGSGRLRYLVAAVLRNELPDVAVQIGGELSLHTSTGRRLATVEPASVTLAPGSEGLLIEQLLDVEEEPGDSPRIGLDLEVRAQVEDPDVPAVTVGDVSYERRPPQPCTITATITNRSGRDIDQPRIAMLGYVDGQLSTVNATDLSGLPAGGSVPFSTQVPAAGCPAEDRLTDLRVIVEPPIEALTPAS